MAMNPIDSARHLSQLSACFLPWLPLVSVRVTDSHEWHQAESSYFLTFDFDGFWRGGVPEIGWSGTCCIEHTSLELAGILLPLPLSVEITEMNHYASLGNWSEIINATLETTKIDIQKLENLNHCIFIYNQNI